MRLRLCVIAACAPFLAAGGCLAQHRNPPADPAGMRTDSSRLAVPGGEIWYRVVGGGRATPVILLHGGPGLSSVYLKSLEALGNERTVVRYDQLGAGKSTVVTDTTFFNIAHFVAELEALRQHLGIERAHLYGHSWGATLALEYWRAHPEHVASLVLASPVLEQPAFFAHQHELVAGLSDSLYHTLQLQESGQPFDTATFRAGMKEYSTRYSQHRTPRPDADSMAMSMNAQIGDYMIGTRLLTPNGTLKDYDATSFLGQLQIPVLYVVGDSDFVGPAIVKRHAALTPGARLVVIPGAAHMTMWDNPAAHLQAVRSFLREVDRRP